MHPSGRLVNVGPSMFGIIAAIALKTDHDFIFRFVSQIGREPAKENLRLLPDDACLFTGGLYFFVSHFKMASLPALKCLVRLRPRK